MKRFIPILFYEKGESRMKALKNFEKFIGKHIYTIIPVYMIMTFTMFFSLNASISSLAASIEETLNPTETLSSTLSTYESIESVTPMATPDVTITPVETVPITTDEVIETPDVVETPEPTPEPTVEPVYEGEGNVPAREKPATIAGLTNEQIEIYGGVINETDTIEVRTYTVQPGDSLWAISSKMYGNGSFYPKIQNDNPSTKNGIHPGDVLAINPLTLQEKVKKYNVLPMMIKDGDIENWPFMDKSTYNDLLPNGLPNYKNDTPVDTSKYTLLGNWRVTGFDPNCAHCCGKTNGKTASGRYAIDNYTCGTNNNLPYGTIIYVEGYGYYRIDDCGSGTDPNHVDIACESHAVCYTMTGRANVYLVYEGNKKR